MELAWLVIAALLLGNFLDLVDIWDAHLHIFIHPTHLRYLCFAVIIRITNLLLFSLACPQLPQVFTKVLAVVLPLLHLQGIHIVSYLGNLLLKHQSFLSL